MTTADQRVERAASRLQEFANRMADEGGVKAKLAEPLAQDADLIRKMKPSLIKARARGEAPTDQSSGPAPVAPRRPQAAGRGKRKRGGGATPWLVVGIALAAGVFVAKWIDWRGSGHTRD